MGSDLFTVVTRVHQLIHSPSGTASERAHWFSMARPLHHEEPDAIYHVTIHSVAEATIVRDDRDRQELVRAMHRTVKRFDWRCLAVSVLDTHYHMLLIDSPRESGGRDAVPERNLRAGVQPPAWSAGTSLPRAVPAEAREDRRAPRAHCSLHRQKPRGSRNRPRPRADTWSSYPGVIGNARCWPFIARGQLLSYFGRPERAEERLAAFVEAQLVEATAAS